MFHNKYRNRHSVVGCGIFCYMHFGKNRSDETQYSMAACGAESYGKDRLYYTSIARKTSGMARTLLRSISL